MKATVEVYISTKDLVDELHKRLKIDEVFHKIVNDEFEDIGWHTLGYNGVTSKEQQEEYAKKLIAAMQTIQFHVDFKHRG